MPLRFEKTPLSQLVQLWGSVKMVVFWNPARSEKPSHVVRLLQALAKSKESETEAQAISRSARHPQVRW